ncbi:cytochrome P450 [Mycena leptocephala]|nr:cytochrome P450 [Mycena leptocephala]
MSLILYVLPPFLAICLYISYQVLVAPRFNALRHLPGPPVPAWFGNHLLHVLNPTVSPQVNELFVKRYGRSVRIRGLGPWDERLLALDPVSVSHIVKNTAIYEKPWPSRRLITSLVGCGMLSAEGQVHKRHRRVAMPAFSTENMRSLVEISFKKGIQLRDVWMGMLRPETEATSARIDVCQFLSRATFDVIGLAGFDYNFNAIHDETNELFVAYKDMFEVAISQSTMFRTLLSIYLPTVNRLFPDKTVRTVQRCREVIHRVAGRLIQEKKQKIAEGEKSGDPYDGKDLLTLLLKSNAATDLPPEHRISDDDILNNINTFLFAGSDTSSLSMTWTLLLLAQHPDIQDRLRTELLSIPTNFLRIYRTLAGLPFLHNVTRESLRLIPPAHSTLRVATQDDEIPTMYPVHNRDGTFHCSRGTFVHLSIEAFNLDKAVWGEDAWEFNPDRWDNLPEAVQQNPWHFSNILTFSAGPRAKTDDKITKYNVVLTRPYLTGKFKDGTQCPLLVSRFTSS